MNMSPLNIVQPLLDSGKNAVSGTSGKTQGNDSFQTLLKDQMAANQTEKQSATKQKTKQTSGSSENKVENKETSKQESTQKTASAEEEKSTTATVQSEEMAMADATVLAQVMAAAVGAQVIPVETQSGMDVSMDAVDLADETGMGLPLSMAADGEGVVSDKSLKEARDIRTLTAKTDKKDVASDEKLVTEGKTDFKAQAKSELKAQADARANVATQTTENTTLTTAQKPASAVSPVATEKSAMDTAFQTQQPTAQPLQQAAQAVVAPQVQVVAANVAEAGRAANQIVQQMGTPEWNQAVSQRVMWMIGQEQQSASLTLNPPELGPVRIVVNVSNNNATANFFSANPDVRQALEGSLPRLREMMEGAGIQLGQAQVGAENSGNQQQEQFASSGSRTQGVMGGANDTGGAVSGVAGETQTTKQVVSKGLVDTFV